MAKDPYQSTAFLVMRNAGFTHEQRRLYTIWAAKASSCEFCGSSPYEPCWNQNEAKKKRKVACRWPHEQRIDWARFCEGLERMGYVGG